MLYFLLLVLIEISLIFLPMFTFFIEIYKTEDVHICDILTSSNYISPNLGSGIYLDQFNKMDNAVATKSWFIPGICELHKTLHRL